MGWNSSDKKDELRDASSRIALVYPESSGDSVEKTEVDPSFKNEKDPAAFLCIRFEPEDLEEANSAPTLYWYVTPQLQNSDSTKSVAMKSTLLRNGSALGWVAFWCKR